MMFPAIYFTLLVALLCPNLILGQDFVLGQTPTLAGDLGNSKIASRIKECYLKDKTNFQSCLFDFWKEIGPQLKNGVPELKISSIDPLAIERIEFNEQSNAVQAEAKFTKITVVGASGIIPKSVKVDTKAKLVTVNVTFPFLNASGDYTLKGTIMLLPVDGSGKFVMNMTGIDAVIVSHVVQKGTGIRTSRLDIDFNIKNIDVKLDGLLGGDEVGTAINNMLNDNSQAILQDIKPHIAKRIEQTFLNMTADAFIDMPVDAFIS